MERFARLGYAAKGIVYAIVGFLAAQAPFGRGNAAPDKQDAFARVQSQPFGDALLIAIAAGLACYATWRILNGVLDSERRGSDAKGLAIRFGSVARGVFYGLISLEVFRLALKNEKGSSSDATSQHWAARAMEQPFGRWLLGAAGIGLLGYAAYQIYRASTDKAKSHLRLTDMTQKTRDTLISIARFGLAARAIVFGLIAISIIRAAIRYDSSAAKGTSGALQQIASQFGIWVLGLVGVGLIAYGIYAFINARYRTIET